MHIEHYYKTDNKHWTLTGYDDANETVNLNSTIYDKVNIDLAEVRNGWREICEFN